MSDGDGIDDRGDAPIHEAYDRNAQYWIQIVREGRDRYQTQITDAALLGALGEPAGLVFLDAGCGEGHLTRLLVDDGAQHVHGVDATAALVTAARTHPAADAATSTFHHADVAALPLPSNSIDVVVANRLPHALVDPHLRFAEFARVLVPGGRFVQLSLHPCFYTGRTERAQSGIAAKEYFEGRTVIQHFNVDGLVSPAPSVQRFYPLETHIRLITGAGFVITDISEPRPNPGSDETYWDNEFLIPLFLMITCTLPTSG
jgi:ubiquinone/menaquinone biosynthesis C-methylase UbiE